MPVTSPIVRSDKSEDAPTSRNGQGLNSEKLEARRILERLEALGQDGAWLAREAGIPTSTLYDNLKRGIAKPEHAVSIAKALKVSVDWLLTGKEPARKGRAIATTNFDRELADEDLAGQLGMKMIPEVDITYSMGGGSVVGDFPEARLVPFRQDWLQRLTRGGPADVFLTRGQGDSMMPTILDDDDVLVNRADGAIRQQDRIWALGYGELGMIKRVRRLPSGLFQLNSDNPAVTPIEATEDELFVVGRVIWIGRRV
jgi:phage repressor protein C with HTH and peptisase S24 domain